MGLEWHNRKRSTNGKFEPKLRTKLEGMGYPTAQIHLRVPEDLARRVRLAAINHCLEINDYCIKALDSYTPRQIEEPR